MYALVKAAFKAVYIILHQINSSLVPEPQCHDIAAGWYVSSSMDTAENTV